MTAYRAPTGDDLGAALRRVVEHLAAVDITAVHPIRRQAIVAAADTFTRVLDAATRRSPRGRRGTRRGHGNQPHPNGDAA